MMDGLKDEIRDGWSHASRGSSCTRVHQQASYIICPPPLPVIISTLSFIENTYEHKIDQVEKIACAGVSVL